MPRRLALLTAFLLLGAALRLHGLGAMTGMVHYDEAYYGVDALSLVAQPRLTPFFPANFGRESLWMYLLAPSLAVFGGSAFGLRIVAMFTGIVTLAAVYRLARELIGGRGAAWALAALAVLFPHVLASHEAFRALLFPGVGALAFALLWSAQRTNQLRRWIAGGVLLGLLAYTYLAARLWIGLAGVTLLWWLARSGSRRRGVLTAGLIAAVIALPLLLYLLNHPAAADERVDQVVVSDLPTLANNVVAWLRIWTVEGSQDVVYNLPGRPLLDLPLALLFAAGIVGLIRLRRDQALWLIGLGGASVASSLLTDDPLKTLRYIGLYVPLALLLGLGALTVERLPLNPLLLLRANQKKVRREQVRVRKRAPEQVRGEGEQSRPYRPVFAVIPALLLVFAGADTLRDFDRWLSSPDLFVPMEQHLYAGIDWMAEHTPPGAPVYVTPFSDDHPVLRLREWRLGDRPVGAFMANECLVVRVDQPAYYFDLTLYDPGFADRLGQWMAVQPVLTDDPRYAVYRAEAPSPAILSVGQSTLVFGTTDQFHVAPLAALPDAVKPGTSVDIPLGLTASSSHPYTLFIHLYDLSSGAIKLVSQTDQPLCPSDPPPQWTPAEVIVQSYSLPIPPDLPPGDYSVALGLYDPLTLARLPIGSTDYAIIHALHVGD